MLSVLEGLSHLHAAGFVHRDLKPSNVFQDAGGQALIGDLGSIRRVPASGVVPGSAKTLFYILPEVVQMGSYTFKSDLYQVGLMLFRLCGGHLPHEVGPWLDPKTVQALNQCTDGVQRTKLENQAVFTRIEIGRAADLATLPPFTPPVLRNIIRKSVKTEPSKRHATATAFMTELHRAGTNVFPWTQKGSYFLLNSWRPKRVEPDGNGQFTVLGKSGASWRRLKSASFATIDEAFRFAKNAN